MYSSLYFVMMGFSPVDNAEDVDEADALGAGGVLGGSGAGAGVAVTGLADGRGAGGVGRTAEGTMTVASLGTAAASADLRNQRPKNLNIQLCLEVCGKARCRSIGAPDTWRRDGAIRQIIHIPLLICR
jgi:hypothetical protein